MRRIIAMFVAAAASMAATPTQAQERYTMDDLEALMDQESWQEILDHALDVRPSRRGKKWKKFLQTAAIGHLTAVNDTGDGERALITAEELLVKHPLLKRSRNYMNARGRIGLDALTKCFYNRSMSIKCSERVETFVNVDPTNDNLAFEAGKLVRLRGSDYISARLFALAFKKKSRRAGCGDDQVILAVQSVLSGARHEPTVAAARKVAFDYCYEALEESLFESFLKASPRFIKSTCPDLKSKGKLSKFQLALCEDSK